jgi:quercetin dioxygenase-like cupin family protein
MKNPTTIVDFQHRDWSDIPVEQIGDGIERQMIWGERLMVCRLRLAPHVVTAEHSHPHEQMTIVQKGRVLFVVDGHQHVASAGDLLHFPSGIRHGATMLDEEVVLIDIFSPVREDFLAQESALSRRSSGAPDGAKADVR